MLYVIGGASRSGKTLLSRRAVSEKGIPYFPLDALFGALVNGAPQFGLSYDDPLIERPTKLWPISKHFFNFFFQEEKDFLIEGDSILPSQVNEMIVSGRSVKSCFFGYTQLDKDEKLLLVRKYHQGDIDWTKELPDEEMLPLIDEMISFSKYLKEECNKYGIMYFDVSHDFDDARNAAFEYLFNT